MLCLLVDNYDSFVHNLSQYIQLLNTEVLITRNDEIDLKHLLTLNITHIVLSPGAGSPSTNSGKIPILLSHYVGKVPILGVCLGLQIMVDYFGGQIVQVGHIVHGKTSLISHSNSILFDNLPNPLRVTRYHSLIAKTETLPDCLSVIAHLKDDKKNIQAIQHKEHTIVGVQFHPESILSESGSELIGNFLKLKHASWSKACNSGNNIRKKTILSEIVEHRIKDITNHMNLKGMCSSDYQSYIDANILNQTVNLYDVITNNYSASKMCVMAEFKRASPSEGDINIGVRVLEKVKQYLEGGASVLSILTEPHYFKGRLIDMQIAATYINKSRSNRACLLRKDFIVDEYQVLESRVYGADSILLIVAILSKCKLEKLIHLSRKCCMEPLVEVVNQRELELAVESGAKVIGINNRDLHTFKVDTNKTTQLIRSIPKDIIVVALSGIKSVQDVITYHRSGVKAVLIGQALMQSQNTSDMVRKLVNFNE